MNDTDLYSDMIRTLYYTTEYDTDQYADMILL